MMDHRLAEKARAEYLAGLINRVTASLINAVRSAADGFALWRRRRVAVRQVPEAGGKP